MIDDSIKCLFVFKLWRTNKAKKKQKPTSKSMMNVYENCNIIVILHNYNIIKMYVWVDTLHNCIQLFLSLFIKKNLDITDQHWEHQCADTVAFCICIAVS